MKLTPAAVVLAFTGEGVVANREATRGCGELVSRGRVI